MLSRQTPLVCTLSTLSGLKFSGDTDLGIGRNTVSRVLFRKKELTEFCAKLAEFRRKLCEFALAHKE